MAEALPPIDIDELPEGITVERMHADEEPARRLLVAMSDELNALYAKLDGDLGTVPAPPDEMAPPNGTFVVAVEAGDGGAHINDGVIACGGLKRLEPGLAEIKRMYVIPEARGRGLGGVILRALESEARRLGYERIRLDTGAKQPEAKAIYDEAGYEEIADYNGNPYAAHWFERRL